MEKQKKERFFDVFIQTFSPQGFGLGQISYPEGKSSTIEVPFTMPGDLARVLLLPKKKGVYQSRLQEILQPSQDRTQPVCIHFEKCGGCRWQHVPYERQLIEKETFVRHCLAPYLTAESVFYSIVPCDPLWSYRNKMEFSFSSDKAKNQYLGLILQGSQGRVFKMKECHLVNPWFVQAVKATQLWWEEETGLDAYHPGKNTGSLRTLTVREGCRTGDRMVMLTVSGNPDYALHKRQIDRFVAFLRDAIEPIDPNQKLSIFLRIQQIAKGVKTNFYELLLYGPEHIRDVLHIQDRVELDPLSLEFKISPVAFFQPNTRQAEKLYSRALQLGNIADGSIVYDLYCGTGTLGICTARRAKHVIGIELSPESVLDARENAKLNGLSNITILSGDVGAVLTSLEQENNPSPDVVVVDPPRSGLDPKALKHVLALKAPKIIYISCNPMTQAANLEGLIKDGYRIESVQPIDQFPQTIHVENIVILRR